MPWVPGDNAASQREAQGEFLDVICVDVTSCTALLTLRPSTQYIDEISSLECAEYIYPTTTTTGPPTLAPTLPPVSMGAVETTSDYTPPWDAWDWGPGHWILASLPVVVLFVTGCLVGIHFRRKHFRKLRRVHVAATSGKSVFGGAALWDFSQMGPLTADDIEDAENASKDLRKAQPGSYRQARLCFSFGEGNELKAEHLKAMSGMLQRCPELTLSLHADWRFCGDREIQQLSGLLARKGRCSLRAVPLGDLEQSLRESPVQEVAQHVAGGPLRLPARVSMESASRLGAALSSGAHGEVDCLRFEVNHPDVPSFNLPLTDLRYGFHGLELVRGNLGDVGVAAACGFVDPWAERLKTIRFVECSIGDLGMEPLSTLCQSAGETLRNLCLSGNRIGDSGVATLANALPTCDGLERLLLDRNFIGVSGAKALAKRLPRSALRELVLGSHLGGNPIGAEGAKALAAALDDDKPRAEADREVRFSALLLEDCEIGVKGAKALAEKLPASALGTLSVARNGILKEGAEAIIEALPACMTSLDLAGNQLPDKVASMVGQLFWRNPYIAVSVAQNPINPVLRQLLTEEHGQRLRI